MATFTVGVISDPITVPHHVIQAVDRHRTSSPHSAAACVCEIHAGDNGSPDFIGAGNIGDVKVQLLSRVILTLRSVVKALRQRLANRVFVRGYYRITC